MSKWKDITKREDVGIYSIRDLTKNEIIYCIERIFEIDERAKFWFDRAVIQVADQRAEKKLNQDMKKGDKWIELLKEYEELLKPYRGKKIGEMPPDVLKKGVELEKEIKKAQEEYFATFDQRGDENVKR